MKSAIVTQVRNECSRVSEWVEYHKKLGFDEIFIYDDNSTDSTVEQILKNQCTLMENKNKFGKYIDSSNPNIYSTEKNHDLLTRLLSNYTEGILFCKDKKFDWIAVIDVDEFIFIENNMKINDYLCYIDSNYSIDRLWVPSYDFDTRVINFDSDKITKRHIYRWSEESRVRVNFSGRCKSILKNLHGRVSCPHNLDWSSFLDTSRISVKMKLFQYRYPPLSNDGFELKDTSIKDFWDNKS